MMTRRLRISLPILLLAFGAPTVLAQEETVVFSPHQQQDVAISKALLEATSTIDMALYSISSESDWVDQPGPDAPPAEQERWKAFRQRLATGDVKPFDMIKRKAKEEGVKCRLILHRAAIDAWAIDSATDYEDVGVQVRYTHKTMHHKFAIVDGKTVINGSGNWSRGAAERYSENTVVYRGHPGLAAQFAGEFRFLWQTLFDAGRASEFDPALAPVPEPEVGFFIERKVWHQSWRPIEVYFTSENGGTSEFTCADRIIAEMKRAKREITIMINHFNMGRISSALIAFHEQRNKNASPADDVKIRVLMDLGEYDAGHSGVSRAQELERAGIEVRYKAFSLSFYYAKAQFMHHKVMIIDSERLVTGSYNWSSTAEFKNYENITVHQGPTQQDVIDLMEGEFARLWDQRRDLLPDFRAAVLSKPGDANYRRFVPVHFTGPYYHSNMALTRAEIASYREALEALGYRPATEDDPESMENHKLAFFDKETGTFTNAAPDGTFVKDEDVVRAAPTDGLVDGLTPPE